MKNERAAAQTAAQSPRTNPIGEKVNSFNQRDRVLQLLMENERVCGPMFLREHLPRFGARLWEMKREGFVFERERCLIPGHAHRSVQWSWQLIALPERLWVGR